MGPPGREHLGLVGVSTMALGGVGLIVFGIVVFVVLARITQQGRR